MFESIFEGSDVDAAIFPFVLACTLWFPQHVRARETVPICKYIRTLSMF